MIGAHHYDDAAEADRCQYILRLAAASELYELAQALLGNATPKTAAFSAMLAACPDSKTAAALYAAQTNIEREARALH